jgi:hypothetical protein
MQAMPAWRARRSTGCPGVAVAKRWNLPDWWQVGDLADDLVLPSVKRAEQPGVRSSASATLASLAPHRKRSATRI